MPDLSGVSTVEWAYAAGIFDGEGCLDTFRNGRYRLHVSQNGAVLAEWFVERFGGHAQLARPAGQLKTKAGVPRPAHWRWYLGAQLSVLAVLRGLLPYLVIKHEAAAVAIADLEARYLKCS